jgi:hypothetical protein
MVSSSKSFSGLDPSDHLYSVPAFATESGAAFLSNSINDATSLQKVVQDCTFVAFTTVGAQIAGSEDIPLSCSRIAQIGLCHIDNLTPLSDFTGPTQDHTGKTLPRRSLEDFMRAQGADARCIDIIHDTPSEDSPSAQPNCSGPGSDPLPFGFRYPLPLSFLEEHITILFENGRRPGKKLILVGWGVPHSLHFLACTAPAALAHLDGWLDVKTLSDARGDQGRYLGARLMNWGIEHGDGAKVGHYRNAGWQAGRELAMVESFVGGKEEDDDLGGYGLDESWEVVERAAESQVDQGWNWGARKLV